MNPSKRNGSAAESAVVRVAGDHGIPAERIALAGVLDRGDVHLLGGRVVIEVKSRKHHASANEVSAWMAECDAEAARVAGCDLSATVVKRPGTGAGRAEQWAAWLWLDELVWLADGRQPLGLSRVAVQISLGDLMGLVHRRYLGRGVA